MAAGGSARRRTTLPPLAALAAVTCGLLAMFALKSVSPLPGGMRSFLFLAELALVAPGLLAMVGYGIPLGRGLALRPLDGRTAVLMVAAGGSLWLASLGLLQLQYTVWKPSLSYLEMLQALYDALRPHGVLEALGSVAAIALLPALCEETLVRGIVLPSLVPPLGSTGAVVVSAVVFAIIHLDPYRTLFTLAMGLALGFLRVRTGSLTACIVTHAVLNTITFATAPFLDDRSQGLPEARPALGLGLLLAGGAAAFLVLRLLPSLTRPAEVPRLGA